MTDEFSAGFDKYKPGISPFKLSDSYVPSVFEYASASMSQAFDRSLGVRFAESISTDMAESEDRIKGTFRVYQSEEEYKSSRYYRPNVAWEEGMSETRARIYAENYDQRRERERIIRAGDENGPWWLGVVGFGAGIVGSLPDPINLIPFGGGVITGARLAGMGVMRALGRTALSGVIEGAAGNLISSSAAAWDLNRKGEDISAHDVMLDTMFGAVGGAALHSGGSLLSRALSRKSMRIEAGRILNALDDDSPVRADVQSRLEAMERGEAEAYVAYAETSAQMRELGLTDVFRRNVTPEERMALAQGLEKALSDVAEGKPVDVGMISGIRETISKSQVDGLIHALEKQEFTDVNFGRLREDYKAALNEIRTEEGERPFVGDDLVIPANVVKKLYEERMLKDGMSADAVAKMLLDVFHLAPDFASSTRHPHIQAMVRLRDKLAEIGFVGIDGQNRTVIKSGYREKTGRVGARLEKKESAPEGRPTPSSGSVDDGLSRQPGRLTDHRSGLETKKKILILDKEVNRIDWRTQTPEEFPRIPALSEARASSLQEVGIDPKTGISTEERLLADMEARRGELLTPDERAQMQADDQNMRAIDRDHEAALSVIGCVMRIVE